MIWKICFLSLYLLPQTLVLDSQAPSRNTESWQRLVGRVGIDVREREVETYSIHKSLLPSHRCHGAPWHLLIQAQEGEKHSARREMLHGKEKQIPHLARHVGVWKASLHLKHSYTHVFAQPTPQQPVTLECRGFCRSLRPCASNLNFCADFFLLLVWKMGKGNLFYVKLLSTNMQTQENRKEKQKMSIHG